MKTRARKNGFSLLEVVIGMTVLVLVATTAVGSLRTGIATLSATEDSALAIDAIREFSEYTYLNQAIDYLIDFLRVADEYLLEDVKINC